MSDAPNADSGRVMAEAVIWHWHSEDVWVVSLCTNNREVELGHFPSAHDAIGHLNHWADQRRQVVIPRGVWDDVAGNGFDIRPLPPNASSGTP